MSFRNGQQKIISDLGPINVKLYISLHLVPGFSDPLLLRLYPAHLSPGQAKSDK